MVFLSLTSLVRARGPDEFWRKRKIFRLAAHYIGRRRNCYSIAIRNVCRALVYATKARQQRRKDYSELWQARLKGSAGLYNLSYYQLDEGLDRAGIQLDNKTLSNLAIYEPQSFAAISAVAKESCKTTGVMDAVAKAPFGMDLRYQLFMKKKASE